LEDNEACDMAIRPNAPGEFSGHQQRNTVAPPTTPAGTPGHRPTNDEKLRLTYLTGQHEDSTLRPDAGEAWEGLLPLAEAIEAMPKHTNIFGDDL
jgi:hypothetical protein